MPHPCLLIDPTTHIPDLLAHYPQARVVLDRYGLRGCGGPEGPAESLRFFARAHGVDESTLLVELRKTVEVAPSVTSAVPNEIQPRVDDTIYRRFFMAGIAVVLTAGASWGAWILSKIGIAHQFTGVSVFEINAHGHAQIFGWVGLFIMGFAYQAFPRMWQTHLAVPKLAVAVFLVMLGGLVTKTIGMAAPGTNWGISAATGGGVLELMAIIAFVVQIGLTFARSTARLEPWIGFVLAALAFFVIQAALDLWHTWATMTARTDQQLFWYVSTYQAPLRDLQIHGLALLMILGVNLRMLPGLYEVPAIPCRRAWAALVILCSAVVGEVFLFIAYRWSGNQLLAELLLLPWVMLIVGAGLIALPWKLWRPLRDVEGEIDRCGKFIRAAYGWLAVSLTMLLLLPLYLHISGIPFSHAYYGAIRHAIAVGFISLMIMGFAAKVVPTLNGVDPRGLTQLWGPFALINIGCFLRVAMQILTDAHPRVFAFVGISGVLEVTALAWWGIGLIRIMWAGKRAVSDSIHRAEPVPAAVATNHRVSQVLTWFPASEAIFVKHGFAAIGNPILRRTLARQVSVAQAAAMRGVSLEPLRADLNRVASDRAGDRGCNGCSH